MVIGTLYFIDVFSGMIIMLKDYEDREAKSLLLSSKATSIKERPYNIAEIVLLSLIVIETVFKCVLKLKNHTSKKVISNL